MHPVSNILFLSDGTGNHKLAKLSSLRLIQTNEALTKLHMQRTLPNPLSRSISTAAIKPPQHDSKQLCANTAANCTHINVLLSCQNPNNPQTPTIFQ
jgi:hypothetical protein